MMAASRRILMVVSLVCASVLSGCATRQNPDPLESWNRKVYSFNDGLDRRVVRPAAQAYQAVTPDFFRTGVSNFFGNFKDMWSTTNLFLQGRFGDGTVGVLRVGMNTTLGLGGILDVATPMRLYKSNEDFGQTLGVWGMGPGAYIVWPLFGPSTVRDSLGMPGEMYFSPTTLTHNSAAINRMRSSVSSIRAPISWGRRACWMTWRSTNMPSCGMPTCKEGRIWSTTAIRPMTRTTMHLQVQMTRQASKSISKKHVLRMWRARVKGWRIGQYGNAHAVTQRSEF